jgi:hypothetical protein
MPTAAQTPTSVLELDPAPLPTSTPMSLPLPLPLPEPEPESESADRGVPKGGEQEHRRTRSRTSAEQLVKKLYDANLRLLNRLERSLDVFALGERAIFDTSLSGSELKAHKKETADKASVPFPYAYILTNSQPGKRSSCRDDRVREWGEGAERREEDEERTSPALR